MQAEWRISWGQRKGARRAEASKGGLPHAANKLHRGLAKAESSVITQLRTGKVGLNGFLANIRVPGVTLECSCGEGVETVAHVLLHCPNEQERRAWSRRTTVQELLSWERAQETASWVIKGGRLSQFSLAR